MPSRLAEIAPLSLASGCRGPRRVSSGRAAILSRLPSTSIRPVPVSAGEPGSGDDSGAADEELDELTAKLYPKLRRKLQAGLLNERERAGKLTDLL